MFYFNGNPLIAEYSLFLRNQHLKDVKMKIPERLSYDYVQMISSKEKESFETCLMYKGITFSMISIIKDHRKLKEYSEDDRSTDKGNQIIHAVCAFSNDIAMTNYIDNNEHLFNCKNVNGWTPLFLASFKNNEIMIKHLFDQNIEDYFGNTAYFYAKH